MFIRFYYVLLIDLVFKVGYLFRIKVRRGS